MTAAILSILASLIPFAIKIINAYLTKSEVDKEVTKKFIAFVESISKDMNAPTKLRESFINQRAALKKRLAEIEAKEGVKE